MRRIFVGVKIDAQEKLIQTVDEIKLELKKENIRWVNTHNYHITLKFFGNTEEKRIDEICQLFDKIAGNYQSFNIKVANTGVFVRKGIPKILWLDTFENELLYKLYDGIEESIFKLGYNRENRPFKAHLTIGGIKFLKDKKQFFEVMEKYNNSFFQDAKIDRFILFESIMKPGGPKYTELKSWKLSNDQ
jgi:RNA 2',3'-cyclic 3'-phosphodiesterase